MEFLFLKWLHLLAVIVVLGTGLGSAFYLYRAHQSKELRAIRFATRNAVLADWIFTLPGVILLPLSGGWMMALKHYPITEPWLFWGIVLFFMAGIGWLPAAYLQIRMKASAEEAAAEGKDLPQQYWKWTRYWLWLGVIAFPAMIGALYLMVFKPG